MIAIADGPRPETIIFLRTEATGLYTLEIEAETNDIQSIDNYVSALRDLAGIESVDPPDLDTRGSQSTIRLLVRFTSDAFDTNSEAEESS